MNFSLRAKRSNLPCGLGIVLTPLCWASSLAFLAMTTLSSQASNDVVAKVQKAYQSIHSLSAKFKQETTIALMETVIHKQGSFVFEKPKKIRIEYSSPDKKIYISNASTLWVYRPEDKEVEVYDNIKDVLSRDALVFFGDLSNLEKDYSILVHTLEEGRHQLVLTPKSKLSNFKTISLWVEPPSFLVQEAVLFSKNGNPTRYIFSNIKNNPKTRAEMFNFKKPRRVREIRL